jgi:hypothetical protein
VEPVPASGAPPPSAAPGTPEDVARVRRFTGLLVARLVAAGLLAPWMLWGWAGATLCFAAPVVALLYAPKRGETAGNRVRAMSSAGTAGFMLFVGACLYGLFGAVALGYGLLRADPDAAWTGVLLLAFVPLDYGLLRLGLRAVGDDPLR